MFTKSATAIAHPNIAFAK